MSFVISQAGGPSWDSTNYPNFGTWTADSTNQSLWHYAGAWTNSSWSCNWALDVNPDPFVSNSFAITNNTAAVQTFSISVMLPVSPAVPFPSATFGSVSGSLGDTNNNGFAQWTTVGAGSAFYNALIDGGLYHQLLQDPFSVTTPPIPGATTPFPSGTNFFSLPTGQPGVLTSIGITNTFTLTPGDSITFVSTFRVDPVPAPAAATLLGLGGLLAARRRR
jgi:MYXO-CTERM domain-containing protein